MESHINLLVLLLEEISSDDSIEVNDPYYSNTHPLVVAVKYMSNQYLIDSDGHPNQEHIDTICRAGFPIFPGEQDRFGWLTGCIQLSRGIILFG